RRKANTNTSFLLPGAALDRSGLRQDLLLRNAIHVVDGFGMLLHGGHQLPLIVGLLEPTAFTLDAFLHCSPPRRIEPGSLRSSLDLFGKCLASPCCGFTWPAKSPLSVATSCCGRPICPGRRVASRSSTLWPSESAPFRSRSWRNSYGRRRFRHRGRSPSARSSASSARNWRSSASIGSESLRTPFVAISSAL